ncbi:MAG: hypothetical protein JXR51_05700 [Bacteroidales bacterium]|nr:hypothetical protein [Bacteroidales bacterium]MBN2756654.1 hypothetical protein [Bacteroidales bacterium]
MIKKEDLIIKKLTEKAEMKQQVFSNTLEIFNQLKNVLIEIADSYSKKIGNVKGKPWIKFIDRGSFQCALKFAGDMILFNMHSNVFEFNKEHQIWKTPYAQKNVMGTYCGIINIYNFLSDSFKYNRESDLGYLVGRLFINKDFHYFVEGKRQMSSLYKDFGVATIDKNALKEVIESSLQYVLEFDLLVPPYDNMKIISLELVQQKNQKSAIQTGKRLGFQFKSDDIQGEEAVYTGH